jgi:hypothetical protein
MRILSNLLLFVVLFIPASFVYAGPDKAETAVTQTLFDADMENVSYSIRRDGFVDILFGPSVDEKEYIRIVERLRAHPDVPGVLAGRGKSDYCPVRH